MLLATFLATTGFLLLLIPPAIYASQDGRPLAYLLIALLWALTYALLRSRARRRVSRANATRRGRVLLAGSLAALALLVNILAAFSIGLAIRYSLTPATLRALDRYTARHSTPIPAAPGCGMTHYATSAADLPLIIYIHGTPGHGGVWSEYLLDPVPGFQSIAVDRPGFSRSAACGPLTSFEQQAEAIAQLLVSRRGKRPILVGHSLGGPIAARVAAQYPDRVGGLVILAGSLDPELESPAWYSEATELPGIAAKMPELYQTANAEVAAARDQTERLSKVLDRIVCPVHVVHGTADRLVPVKNVEYIQKAMTHAAGIEVTVIEGEGHALPSRRSTAVREAIADVAGRMVAP